MALRIQRTKLGRDKHDRLFKTELKVVHGHPGLKLRTAEEIQFYKQRMGLPDTVEGKRDISMQLYLPHDVTNVSRYFYDSRNIPLYKDHCNRILKYYYASTPDADSFSLYGDESDQEMRGHDDAASV